MKAILLCAGMGTRLRPMTFLKPKPLLSIGDKPLLERTIQMLQSSGITDITAVLGHMADIIIPVLEKHEVNWVISDKYTTHNNHSSLQLVAEKLDDCLIIDGDLYLQRNITQFVVPGRSQFIAQQTTSGKEWELLTDSNDRIIDVHKNTSSGYGMSGVSYWTGPAAEALQKELQHCTQDEFWEDAAIRVMKKLPVYLTRAPQFLVEIDSLYDAVEKGVATPDNLADQCSLTQPEKLKGLTNATFLIDYGQGKKALRIPGLGTSSFINRDEEVALVGLMNGLGITPETTFYADGIKVTQYMEGYSVLTRESVSPDFFKLFSEQLRKMHSIRLADNPHLQSFSLFNEIDNYERKTGVSFVTEKERQILRGIAKELDNDDPVLCHRDLLPENILHTPSDVKIIDFEYSAFSSHYWDVGCFITEMKLSPENRELFMASYGELDPERVLKAEVLVDYIWGLWGWLNNCIDYGRARMVTFHNNFTKLQENNPYL